MRSLLPRCDRVLLAALTAVAPGLSAQEAGFGIEEASIAQIHQALRAGTTTCRWVAPDALAVADSLDRRCRTGGLVGPLHCVPMIVKENMETLELPTTAGSLALEGLMTGRDATIVRQ